MGYCVCLSILLMALLGVSGIAFKNIVLLVLGVLFLCTSIYLEVCNKHIKEAKFFLGQLTNTYMLGLIDDDAYDESKLKLVNNLNKIERFFYERSKK